MAFVMEEKVSSISQKVCVGAMCDRCKVALKPVYVHQDGHCSGFMGALYLNATGDGYAEYWDGDSGTSSILCRDCARWFLETLPFMDQKDEAGYPEVGK